MRRIPILLLSFSLMFNPVPSYANDATVKTETTIIDNETAASDDPQGIQEIQADRFIITKEEALADFNYMWETLNENFPHLHSAQFASYGPKVDLAEIIRSGKESIEDHPAAYFTSNEFYKLIYDNLIGNFGVLGHLAPRNTRYYFFIDAWEKMEESGVYMFELFGDDSEEVQKPFYTKMFYEQLQRPETVAFYQDFAEYHGYIMKDYTQEELLKMAQNTFDVWVAGDIIYVHLKTLTSERFEVSEIMIELLQEFFAKHNYAKNVIIDIQGNGGGHAHVWLMGIVAPLWQRPIEAKYLAGSMQGDLNKYYWGNEVPKNRKIFYHNDGNRRWRNQFRGMSPSIKNEDIAHMDFLAIRTISIPRKPKESLGYKAKIWLLVDERTNSNADNFAYFCRASGFATVVGSSKTRGMGTGGQAHFMSLPYSGLIIDYEPFQGFNFDGTANGIIGSPPEVLIKNGQTSLEYVLEKIKESESPGSEQTLEEFFWKKIMESESSNPGHTLIEFITENIKYNMSSDFE